MKSKLVSLVTVVLLAGCEPAPITQLPVSPAGAPVKLRPLPKAVYASAFNTVLAGVIDDYCSRLHLNHAQADIEVQKVVDTLKAQGFTQQEARLAMDKGVDKARVQRDVFAYIEKNGIIIDEPQTYCAAGEREIARKSAIGALLVKVGK